MVEPGSQLAGNKCQRCIEYRVMFRVEIFCRIFFALHRKLSVNTLFMYKASFVHYFCHFKEIQLKDKKIQVLSNLWILY